MVSAQFFHEQLYRSQTTIEKFQQFPITICGAGALGANLCETLARVGFTQLKVIDRDRVEERNLSTQPFYRSDIGTQKAKTLANNLYRALLVKVEGRAEELTTNNCTKLLNGSRLVIDVFDNSPSRQVVKDFCEQAKINCLHVGLAGDYAEVIWNEVYKVPSPNQDDICDYPLARNLVMLAVALASETIISFVDKGDKNNFTITLGDFAIKPYLFIANNT
ncbi:MAG: ThiF family adenylyltransferase [Acidobacteria bacterium]|nr:ThiF family adenylyltransferase [Acidobacteriota bacterium]